MNKIALCLLIACISGSCRKKADTLTPALNGQITINMEHVCGNKPLLLKDKWYTNAAGEVFRINLYQYFLSNFSLIGQNGSAYAIPESYFLINEAKSDSKILQLRDIPEGSYYAMEFLIGVDSTRNVSGAQTGALDPMSGMFWDWDSGYIMAKLEGISPQSTIGDSSIIYHIGGFAAPVNSIRKVRLEFTDPVTISKEKTRYIHMQGDVLEWFQSPTVIEINKTPLAMNGAVIMSIADNYSDMFRIESVE